LVSFDRLISRLSRTGPSCRCPWGTGEPAAGLPTRRPSLEGANSVAPVDCDVEAVLLSSVDHVYGRFWLEQNHPPASRKSWENANNSSQDDLMAASLVNGIGSLSRILAFPWLGKKGGKTTDDTKKQSHLGAIFLLKVPRRHLTGTLGILGKHLVVG